MHGRAIHRAPRKLAMEQIFYAATTREQPTVSRFSECTLPGTSDTYQTLLWYGHSPVAVCSLVLEHSF